jgi:hypothetical protein
MISILSNPSLRSILLPAAILGATLSGCTDSTAPDPLQLQLVAGDEQEAQANTTLSDSLVVKVTGLDGLPREKVAVTWSPSSGHGTVIPGTGRTDAEGLVKASWTLGSDLGSQTVTVAAPGTDTLFQAWAAPPPPDDWLEVLEIQPAAVFEGEALWAQIRIWSTWPGTVRLKTRKSCLLPLEYPGLYSATGEQVAHPYSGCWTVASYHFIPPGDTLFYEWRLGIQDLDPGEYTLRYRFDIFEINGTPATVPDMEMPVTLGG